MLHEHKGTPMDMEPVLNLDESITDPGYCKMWGHTLGKNKKAQYGYAFKM